MAKTKRSDKPSIEISGWVWKALIGVAFAVMAMLLSQGGGHENVTYLNARDKAKLKEVFFGNETWTVLCVNQTTIDRPLTKAFQYSAKKFKDLSSFGVLDCGAKLSSGRTIYQRLQLKKDVDPCIFIALPGQKPKQIPPKQANSPTKLTKFLKDELQPKMFEIANSKALHSRCSGSASDCLLIFRSAVTGAGILAKDVSKDHSEIIIGLLDRRKRLALAGIDEVTAMFFQNKTVEGDPAITRGVRIFAGDLTADNLDQFLLDAKINSPDSPLVPLRKQPKVVNIKTEETEKKKPKKKDAVEESAEALAEREARQREAMEAMMEDLIQEGGEDEDDEEEEEEEEEVEELD